MNIRMKMAALLCAVVSCSSHAAVYDDMIAAVKTGDKSTVIQLINRGMDVNTTDAEGNTLLILATREDKRELVDLFILQRAKINARNIHGDSALRIAAFQGNLPIVERLVAGGAQINMEGWTPLIYAAFNGHLPVVRFLIDHGADINAASETGMTATIAAARGGFMEILQTLTDAGADLNKKTDRSETALDWAAKHHNNDAINYLKSKGAVSGKSLKLEIR
jgi:ankyrin repeat protein